MPVIQSEIDVHGEAFAQNREAMLNAIAAFRDVEAQVILEATAAPERRVIATGGGAVLREANRQALREHSTVMYLRTTPEDLAWAQAVLRSEAHA